MESKIKEIENTTKLNFILFAVFVLFLAFIILSEPKLTGYNVSGSGQPEIIELSACNQLSIQGGKYYLKNDINVKNYNNDKCFKITNSYIELDCRGFKIFGERANAIALSVESTGSNTKIKNCIIDLEDPSIEEIPQNSPRYGILINKAQDILIENVTFSNSFAGIFINESLGKVNINKNYFDSAQDSTKIQYGILNINTNNTKITNNTFSKTNTGILATNSSYLTLSNNNFNDIQDFATSFNYILNSNFTFNKIENSSSGINIIQSSFNLLSNNTFLNTKNADINLYSNSNYNNLTYNTLTNNDPNEIVIDPTSQNNLLINNILPSNSQQSNKIANVTEINNCTTLENPNTIYKLNDSFNASLIKTVCIQINADDIILEGNKNLISCLSNTTKGVVAIGRKNITITNLEIANCDEGILFDNVANSTINMTSLHENSNGILMLNSKQNKILSNEIYYNLIDGIYLENSSFNKIEKSIIASNERYGIALIKSSNNKVFQNIIAENGEENIYEEQSSNDITENEEALPWESISPSEPLQFSETQLINGVSFSLKTNENATFDLFSIQYHLILIELMPDSANFIITPSIGSISLYKNEIKKLNLNDDSFLDLQIQLKNINQSNTEIFLKKINESIPVWFNEKNQNNSSIQKDEFSPKKINPIYENSKKEQSKEKAIFTFFVIILVGVIIIVLVILIMIFLNKKQSPLTKNPVYFTQQ